MCVSVNFKLSASPVVAGVGLGGPGGRELERNGKRLCVCVCGVVVFVWGPWPEFFCACCIVSGWCKRLN